jgi:hypothetical protein
VVECLPHKCEATSSNPSTTDGKKKKDQKWFLSSSVFLTSLQFPTDTPLLVFVSFCICKFHMGQLRGVQLSVLKFLIILYMFSISIKTFKKVFIFRNILHSRQNWMECTEISNSILCLHIYTAFPIVKILCRGGLLVQSMYWHWPSIFTGSAWFIVGFILGTTCSMGCDKHETTCISCHSVTRRFFCALMYPSPSLTPGSHCFFSYPLSFAFSRVWYGWNPIAFWDCLLSVGNKHLRFLHTFLILIGRFFVVLTVILHGLGAPQFPHSPSRGYAG